MRKPLLLLFALSATITMSSCLVNDNEVMYTDYITLTAGTLPDTVVVNTPVEISLRATTPSTCWQNIRFFQNIHEDTLCTYYAWATYVNHGEECYEVPIFEDTVVTFTPTLAKSYVFQFVKSYTEVTKDTVVVIPAE